MVDDRADEQIVLLPDSGQRKYILLSVSNHVLMYRPIVLFSVCIAKSMVWWTCYKVRDKARDTCFRNFV